MLDINELMFAFEKTMQEYSQNPQAYIAKQRRKKRYNQILANALFPYTMQSEFSSDMQNLTITFINNTNPN